MRTFIAIDLPSEVKNELKKYQRELKGAKFSFAKDFHITLKFLGELTPQKVDAIKEKLKQIKFGQFSAEISSIGFFPETLPKIRVVWVGIKPEENIKMLQAKIDESLKEYFTKEKDFKSHITIARVKFVENKKELTESISNIKIQKLKFVIENFKLKKSTLTREGPVYEDIEIFSPLETPEN